MAYNRARVFRGPALSKAKTRIGLGGAKGGRCPPTGPGLDPEIRGNPMRSVNILGGG